MKNIYYLFVCVSVCLLGACTHKQKETSMNVVVVLVDDLGYGDLGAYGQQKIKTPHIDKMASEGMLFTQHYAGSSVCAPSRASIMTGKHTGHTTIRGNKEILPEGQMPMDENELTIAKLMKQAGYATGIFGKWGLGYPGSKSTPTTMGFDTFFGYNCQREAHTYYPNHLWSDNDTISFPKNKESRETYSADLIHQKAKEFIASHQKEPFFAMLTYTLPHAELKVPKDSIFAMYDGVFEETPYKGGGYSSEPKPHATFAAMVSRIDFYMADLLKQLKDLGIADNTLVIFTSDNGPHREGGADPEFFNSSGPLRGIKRDLYEGGIRVPMIVWNPKKVKAGVSNHVSAFWDFLPTLADLTHQKLKTATDGISFLPTIFSQGKQSEHDYLYWEFHEQGGRKALRQGKWKLVVQPIATGEPKVELFDLDGDLGEKNDISAQYPEKTKELLKLMDIARTESQTFNFGKK